jgi:hypothetical protein
VTNEQRIASLQSAGYTEREAAFLCLAALHSGYFVRRQFSFFIGKNSGQLDENFLKRALGNNHVRATTYRADRILYHIGSKPLYDLIGEPDNRNRRQHQVFTIKCRVMALDFVLQHRTCKFAATEREKLDLFCGRFSIDIEHLPAKLYRATSSANSTTRYFVDKYPIFVTDADSAVHFCYIDEGLHSTSGFEGYLHQYEALLRRLPGFRMVYVAGFTDQCAKARRVFDRFAVALGATAPLDPQVARLLAYFRNRDAFERRDLKDFTQAKLIQFREDRASFDGSNYERMFQAWKCGGDEAVLGCLGLKASSNARPAIVFETHILRFNYQLFGTLSNGNWRGTACG